MSRFEYLPEDTQINPVLMRAMAVLAVSGCAAMLIATVAAAAVVDDKNWMADTISDLAAGRWEQIQDFGIYALIMATAAAATGAANLHLGGTRWALGCIALVIAVPCMVIIAAREAYSPTNDGTPVHYYVVLLMGAMLTAGPLLMAPGAARVARGWQTTFVIAGLGFGALVPIFFFVVPTSHDGLVERVMGLFAMLWIGGLGVMFWNAASHIERRYRGPRRN
ncbi:DUF998 domain-containing protein [Paracoccus tegillarcae]|uniref:DUF998 domain-containing protein n=1 Tax=Paracoccus tegillarcae TaxID=1529068 RepID=A0A2K9EP94_9RHOB|nr:DUF998 domain-containing protein [Paracoccus tegillarcae]AUH32526.1 hypothetical protein CUV01_03205 [Paracoccus tegillarcae]